MIIWKTYSDGKKKLGLNFLRECCKSSYPGYGHEEMLSEGGLSLLDSIRFKFKEYDKIFENIEDKVVVDIGCGSGSQFFSYLKVKNLEPKLRIALDLDYELSLSSINHKDGRSKVNASFTDLPFKNSSVDIIYSRLTDLKEPILDHIKFWECIRTLKKGGVYISNLENNPSSSEVKEKKIIKLTIPFVGDLYTK